MSARHSVTADSRWLLPCLPSSAVRVEFLLRSGVGCRRDAQGARGLGRRVEESYRLLADGADRAPSTRGTTFLVSLFGEAVDGQSVRSVIGMCPIRHHLGRLVPRSGP